jgi:hypothetical protein
MTLGDCRNSFFAFIYLLEQFCYSQSPNLASLNNLHGLFFVFLGLIWIGWPANQSRLNRPWSKSIFLFYSRLFPGLIVTPWTPITNPEEFVLAVLQALGDGISNNDSDNYEDENEGGGGGILAAAQCKTSIRELLQCSN